MTASLSAPGPLIVMLLLTTSSPDVSVIVLPLSPAAKMILPPLVTSIRACRSDPTPESLVFATVIMLAAANWARHNVITAAPRNETARGRDGAEQLSSAASQSLSAGVAATVNRIACLHCRPGSANTPVRRKRQVPFG